MQRAVILVLIWALLAPGIAIGGEGPMPLGRNPFSPPDLNPPPPPPVAQTVPEARADDLELRATLVAGEDSLANVNGTLLKPGQEIEGFRLVRVGEGESVFAKDGETIVVTLRTAP
ncbi:MAG: hypothetical protein C0617_11810 [Desulfuromonas sp.]|uniref:hypothetical protein n=1 Tax=Desulfuromonas sp. TaxID=892 RepID=UPI000CBBE07D|nr:hypothetical protein [Desulfuromonas sp.]PLX83216.1 MAG: hypothetical protein C0617_11810 [Desulfuromonas sp.]